MSWWCSRLSFCSATIDFPSVSSYEAADLALAFIDPLPPLLGSLLSLALPSWPSGVALLATFQPPIAGADETFRSSVMRSRVQLEFLKILGLVFAQSAVQVVRWDERMVPSCEVDLTFSFCFCCTVQMMQCRLSVNKP